MSTNLLTQTSSASGGAKADRIGVIASVFCAIHCAATPLLLLSAPAFGELWSHPASHWIVALLVVPLALVMVLRGFRVHRKRWIVATGLLGMTLVIVGAVIPYWPDADPLVTETTETAERAERAEVATTNAETPEIEIEEEFVWVVGEEFPEEEALTHAAGCLDSCCPSLVTDSEGNTKLHIPAASLVTTLGGVALICTHLGNLCACRKRKTAQGCDSLLC